MSDLLIRLGRGSSEEVATAAPTTAPIDPITLPHVVEIPTRYFSRLAVGETIRAFAELATVEMKVEEGALRLTFTRIESDSGEVLAEFLNHALYGSATESASEIPR